MNKFKVYFSIVCDKEILIKSLKIALIVGTLLNIINQGDKIIALDFEKIDHFKSILTYMVPFMVSAYTALSIKLKFKIGTRTPIDTNLKCKTCGNKISLKKDDTVPLCNTCKEKTKWRINLNKFDS